MIGEPVGAPLRRVEDARLLAGAGRFLADVTVPGLVHARFVRSSHAHARISAGRPHPADAGVPHQPAASAGPTPLLKEE